MAEPVSEKPTEVAATVPEVPDITAESSTAIATTDAVMEDAAVLEKMQKAMKQIEFYFADANLPYDKFMWTLYSKDPEHWISIETVGSFKRMREYSSEGVPWLAKALKLSTFLEVDETGTKVRRTTEPQEPKNQFERSIYAKGFGEEEPTLQGRLEEFFSQYGGVAAVRMRRDEAKKFKSSVFVEFNDFETVDKFLKADPKPTWEGKELLIMTKEDYCEMKIKEKGLTGKSANHRREVLSSKKFDAFREMARAKSSSKGTGAAEGKKDVFLEFLGHKILIKQNEEGNGTIDEKDIPFVKGVTLKFEGCGGDVSWGEIKDPIKARFDGKAPYIKYARGENSGLVGFYKPLTEEDIAYIKTTIPKINSHDVTWTIPTEEEEKQFEIERAQAAARNAFSQSGSRDSGRGRGGRGGGRGRGGRGGGRGRGGRGGGGRDRNAEAKEKAAASAEEVGEKRKRAVEPGGAADTGVRGSNAPPTIQTAKKVKTNDGGAAPAS